MLKKTVENHFLKTYIFASINKDAAFYKIVADIESAFPRKPTVPFKLKGPA